ncbi:hypothetical protein HAX54_005423 [Datura stramonium]|uniref:Uncharacterized protein n=1 Tax=Datura stramonium TaxID=4076 RepID=A0ABS8RWF4_DATST|nr:hypothetical protein [Datura stramonium]
MGDGECEVLNVSDDHHLGRHPFDGEVDSHQSSNGPPLTPSRSGSTWRVMEDLRIVEWMTRASSDHYLGLASLGPTFKVNVGDDGTIRLVTTHHFGC